MQQKEIQRKFSELVVAAVVVVIYDAMAPIASQLMNVDFTYFALGSTLIYFIAPFILAWRHGFWIGAIAGFLIGFTDSTAGLWVALQIGPQEFKDAMQLDTASLIFVVAFVTLEAGLMAC